MQHACTAMGHRFKASTLSAKATTGVHPPDRLKAAHLRNSNKARSGQCMAVSVSQGTEGLVLPAGEPGSWDSAGVGSAVVRCFINDSVERWCMWYSGRNTPQHACAGLDAVTPGSGSLGVAISNDGVDWMRGSETVAGARGDGADADVGQIMMPNEDWWCFDTAHLAVSDVQILSSGAASTNSGVFWMFYCGGDFNVVDVPPGMPGLSSTDSQQSLEGLRVRPGLAMSQDGRNWARIEGDHHTGALFDVGAEGEWDALMACSPVVLNAAPKDMRLFYHSWDPSKGRYVVGLATSEDGFKWSKKGVVFDPAGSDDSHDALGATMRHVVKDVENRQYIMFYEAVAKDNSRSVGMAVSKDGLRNWKRCPTAVLSSLPGGWDAGSVGAPCVVAMSFGKWRLYYSGKEAGEPGPWQGVGLALSAEGGELFEGVPTQFNRRVTKD